MAILRERKLFLIILVLVLLSPAYLQSAVLERISLTVQNFHPRLMFDPSAAIRLTIWKRAIPIISNNLFLGYGYWSTQTILKSEAHSQYFAVIIETGLVGFFVFCWLIVRMFKNSVMLRQRADPGFLKSLGLGYIAGLAAVLATCFFSETLEAFRMVGPLWFVTGLVTSANRLLSLSQKKSEKIGMDGT